MVIILTINNGENYDGAYNDYDGENHDGDYNDFNGKIIMVIILIIMVRIIMMVINDYGENHYDDNDDLHIIYDLYTYILKVKKFAESAFQSQIICRNLDNNILQQRCVNHPNYKNFVSKGHFC